MRFIRNASLGLGLALFAFAIAFAIISYGPRRYVVARNHYAEEAVWNGDSLFLTVRTGGFAHSELKGTSHLPILAAIFSMAAGNDFVVLPGELTVFQYGGEQIHKDKVVGHLVQAVPYGDTLYFIASDPSKGKKVWNWHEAGVFALTGPEAEKIIKAGDEQTGAGDNDVESVAPTLPKGWHRAYLNAGRSGTKSFEVTLQNATAVIKIEQSKTPGKGLEFLYPVVRLEASNLKAPVTISGAELNGPQEISAEEFATLRAQDLSPHLQRHPARIALGISEYLIYLLIPFSPLLISVVSILRLKSKLLANLPEHASFPNAAPEQFTALDRNRLDELTPALENLGFKRLLDYTMVSDMAVPIPAFGRLLVNERNNCFAEINQVFPPRKKPTELACSFTTRFEGGWTVSTGTRKPNGGTWIMRLPKSVWQCKPGLDPVSPLQAHQQQCAELSSDLGFRALPGNAAGDYFPGVQSRMQQRRVAVRKKLVPAILFEYYAFSFCPRLEWKGDWPAEAAKRSGLSVRAAGA
ncbi:MAG: hypothetical protein WB660_20915 [Candidatus Sulfotelmatobacter sp.]